MASFGVKIAAGLAQTFFGGREGEPGEKFTNFVINKIQGIGEDIIKDAIGTTIGGPMGAAQRITEAVRTGGQSEFDRTRAEFLSSITPSALFPGSGSYERLAGNSSAEPIASGAIVPALGRQVVGHHHAKTGCRIGGS